MGVRTQGQVGSAEPPLEKWMNNQKAKTYKKDQFSERGWGDGRCRERRYAGHIFFSDILLNAPFRSHIFKIFFASGGKGALTPLTKILQTPIPPFRLAVAVTNARK